MIKVKICGITNLEDALAAQAVGADALGFIFSKKSPRYIDEKEAKNIIEQLPPFVTKVGVFVDEDKERVLELAASLSLDALQFHGQESPAYCKFFLGKFKVIKVIFPDNASLIDRIVDYKIDAFLFDIKYEDKIQGKKTLSEDMLKEIRTLIKQGYRVIISGGLTVKNVGKVKKLLPYAIDVASGVEKMVGKKDKELVELFIKKVKD